MIRKAKKQDIPEIGDLLAQVLAVHNASRPDLFREVGQKYDDEVLLGLLDIPGRPIFVYENEGNVVGYIMCQEQYNCSDTLLSTKTLFIDDLCVDEDERGKGVGKQLFEYACDYAKKNGFYNVTLHGWESNPAAMKFYKSLGLKPQYTNLELIVNKRGKIMGNYTEEEINTLREYIEETENCKVLSFKQDDELWWLDVKVPETEEFVVNDILLNFNLQSTNFKDHVMSFIIEDKEMLSLVKFCMNKKVVY